MFVLFVLCFGCFCGWWLFFVRCFVWFVVFVVRFEVFVVWWWCCFECCG